MNGSSYGTWYGTSFSSPIVAGVAALVLSLKPGMSNAALVSLLEQNADDLGAPGFDQYYDVKISRRYTP
jgi:subtilisin family serine protease